MPTLSTFAGIVIRMFFQDTPGHHLPHVHAEYAEYDAVFSIATGSVLAGSLPRKQRRRVEVWIETNRALLNAMWDRAANRRPIDDLIPDLK